MGLADSPLVGGKLADAQGVAVLVGGLQMVVGTRELAV